MTSLISLIFLEKVLSACVLHVCHHQTDTDIRFKVQACLYTGLYKCTFLLGKIFLDEVLCILCNCKSKPNHVTLTSWPVCDAFQTWFTAMYQNLVLSLSYPQSKFNFSNFYQSFNTLMTTCKLSTHVIHVLRVVWGELDYFSIRYVIVIYYTLVNGPDFEILQEN